MTVANFIIAGTEKAGTTAVFSYLLEHPEVVASWRKETNFFRSAGGSLEEYAAHFPPAADVPVVMEASPGYLGEAEAVAPRIRALIPEVKLLFILREPVGRFHSSYQFHRARLNLPADLSFQAYVEACLESAAGEASGDRPGPPLDDWFLKVLPFGCYSRYLRKYFDEFPAEQIDVRFYDDLCADPRAFMEDLSRNFLHIDPAFWKGADFEPVNVTFSSRSRFFHRLAVVLNDRLEPILRPRPRIKSTVVRIYKRLNGAGDGYQSMSRDERALLESFYAPHNRDLEHLLGRSLPDSWVREAPALQGRTMSNRRAAAS